MSGGSSRQYVPQRFLLLLLLSMLAGCSSLFGPPPAPETAQTAAPAEPASEAAPEPTSEAAAPAPASAPSHEASETRRVPPRQAARAVPRRRPTPAPAPAPAPQPAVPPLLSMRTLSAADTHGLLDARVQRPDGKVIGRAIDMLIDAGGKPREMLVNLTGFMGIGDRKMRFAWNAFSFNATGKRAPITLAIAPGRSPAAEQAQAKAVRKPDTPGAANGAAHWLPLIDATVERNNGTRVGRVIDVLIDNRGDPQAAVIDVGSLIHERRSVAADWSALRFVDKDDALAVQTELSDEQVHAAPRYAPDEPIRAIAPAAPASTSGAASAARAASR